MEPFAELKESFHRFAVEMKSELTTRKGLTDEELSYQLESHHDSVWNDVYLWLCKIEGVERQVLGLTQHMLSVLKELGIVN